MSSMVASMNSTLRLYPGDAVRAILAQHPAVIVLRAGDDVRNPHIWPMFSKALAGYHVVRRDPLTVEYMPQTMLLWVRNA